MVNCEGCGRAFTAVGYGMHLGQTSNPPCVKIYQEYLAYEPDSDSASNSGDDDNDTPVTFEGDFFGTASDYGDDDFEMGTAENPEERAEDGSGDEVEWEGAGGSDVDEGSEAGDDDGDDENIAEEYEAGWEAPVHELRPEPGSAAHPELDVEGEDDGGQAGRDHAEEDIQSVPIIVKFPNPAAGTPIQPVPSDESTYTQYGKNVSQSEENVYAPFASKREWEIARWAKLRGPGSTALSELLKIDGVRFLEFYHVDELYSHFLGMRESWFRLQNC